MTGCSADYCTNSSSKGFQMCRFPREEKRRKVWIANVNRADWVPGVSSALCSIHFSDEMWEKTRGGKRRLKCTAVPTLFGDRLIHTSVQEDEPKNIPENEHENFNNSSQEAQERPINNGDVHNDSEEIQKTEGSIEELKEKTPFKETLEQRLNRLEKMYEKSEKSRIALKKSLIAANKRNKKLQQEVRSNKLKESLSCILNEDQIKLLTREYKRMPRWCNETLINAYKLRFACGTAGYEEKSLICATLYDQ